jgi:hypothetical protein
MQGPLMFSETKVEWYSGYTLYDNPRRLLWSGQWFEVVSVLQRGYTPDGAFFKILASDQTIFILKYSSRQESWRIIPL